MNKIIILLLLIAGTASSQTVVQIGNTSESATVFPTAAEYIKAKFLFSPFSSDTSIYAVSNVGGAWKTVPIRVSSLRGAPGTISPWSIASGYTDYSAGVVTIGGDFAPASPAGKLTLGSYATGGYNYIQSYAGLPLYLQPIGNNTVLSNDTYTNYVLAGKLTSNSEAKMQLKNNKFTQFSLESTFYPNGRLFSGVVATGYGSFLSQNSFYLGGGTYTPSDSHAEIIHFDDVGGIVFYTNSGLTAGVSYTPTQRVKINSSGFSFSGALMPNNLSGTSGQVLTSAGPGVTPTWTTGSFNGNFSGTGTATTTFTVTLPVTMPDATYTPSIVPLNVLSAAGWYISARTTTTFTVTYLTALTGAVNFDYTVID